MNILIIEDNADFRVLLYAIVVERCGYANVLFALDVQEALSLLDWADFVLTDVDYPGGGYPQLRPELISRKKPYFLQSSSDRFKEDTNDYLLCFIKKENLVLDLCEKLKLFKIS